MAILAVNKAANGILSMLCITNKTEHGPCRQYNAWAWPSNEMRLQLQPKK